MSDTDKKPQTDAPEAPAASPQVDNSQKPPDEDTRCTNHPDSKAFRICHTCNKPFCVKCLTHHMGVYYCEECRNSTLKAIYANDEHSGEVAAQFNRRLAPSDIVDYPRRAFQWALLSLIPVAGFVISIIALIFGFLAMSQPSLTPGRKVSQKAMYAIIIAAASFIVHTIAGLALLITMGR